MLRVSFPANATVGFDGLSVPVGFHGHNNLGMAVINSVAAVNAGASIIDGTIRGFGAGNEMFRFIVVSIGLAVAIFLGYWRFVKTTKPSKKLK